MDNRIFLDILIATWVIIIIVIGGVSLLQLAPDNCLCSDQPRRAIGDTCQEYVDGRWVNVKMDEVVYNEAGRAVGE